MHQTTEIKEINLFFFYLFYSSSLKLMDKYHFLGIYYSTLERLKIAQNYEKRFEKFADRALKRLNTRQG